MNVKFETIIKKVKKYKKKRFLNSIKYGIYEIFNNIKFQVMYFLNFSDQLMILVTISFIYLQSIIVKAKLQQSLHFFIYFFFILFILNSLDQ